MAIKQIFDEYTLDAAGGTISLVAGTTFDTSGEGAAQVIYVTGNDTLAASWVITDSGDAEQGTRYRIVYDATMTLNGNNITIFGVALTQDQANSKVVIDADYDGSAFITNIVKSDDDATLIPNAVTTTTLTNVGGTITLNPKEDNRYLYLNGSATLAGNWVITGSGTAVEHSFWVKYAATLTVGVNSVTIFGETLTSEEALGGDVSVFAQYDTTNSVYRVQKISGSASAGAISVSYMARVDETYGNDGSGTVDDYTKPFATVTAANTALAALTLTATSRGLVVITSKLTSGITLQNYTDYQTNGYLITRATGNGIATIDDNSVQCDSTVYGDSHIMRTGTGTTPVGCIFVRHASSNVKCYVSNLTVSTSGASDITVATSGGTLSVWAKGDISSTKGGIYASGGTLYYNGKNITTVNACVNGVGGSYEVIANDLVCSEASSTGVDAIGCNTSCSGTITFRNLTYANPNSETVRYNSSGDLKLICTGTVTSAEYLLRGAASAAGTLEIEGGVWLGDTAAVGFELLGTAEYYFHDLSARTDGTDADILYTTVATQTIKIKNLVLETNGTGESIYSSVAINVKNYGGCVANKAVDANVTLQVGTVANNQYIVDSNVTV